MPGAIKKYIDSMTPERILQLAARPEGFRLSRYRWRDEKIAARVRVLKEAGKLRVKFHGREDVVYETVEHTPASGDTQGEKEGK